MKKEITLFFCGLFVTMLMSCIKPTDDALTTITISSRYVESGSMYTRSIIAPEIEDALEKIMPQIIPLTVIRDTFTVFNCQTGEDITLPFNCSYSVTGKSNQHNKSIIKDRLYASTDPLVIVKDTIDVTYGTKNYFVNSYIASFVIVWNNSAVKSVTIEDTEIELPSVNVGNTSVCCITGEGTFNITLNPWDNLPLKARTFTITTLVDGLGIYCETGKWYALSPIYATDTGCSIDVQYEEWIEGGNYF